jgi:hypothetical protein
VTIIPKKKKEKQKKGPNSPTSPTTKVFLKKKKEKGVLPYYWLPNRITIKVWCFINFFFPQSLANLGHLFSTKNHSNRLKFEIIYFRCKLAKNLAIKKIKELHVGSGMYITTHTE